MHVGYLDSMCAPSTVHERLDPPFNPASNSGYIAARPGEYAGALAKGRGVRVLLTEISGARHRDCTAFLRSCTLANTARLEGSGSLTSQRGAKFFKRHADRLSAACCPNSEFSSFSV